MTDLKTVIARVAPKADQRFLASITGLTLPAEFQHPAVLARLLANMHHETMGFTKFVENMNYSAKRLTQVWPSRFPSIAAAQPYANNPQALANNVYANRMGNGPAHSGDGWRFRGGGGLHHTGRAEYGRIEKKHGYQPDRVRDAGQGPVIFDCAVSYMIARDVVAPARARDDATVTRRINGGLIGHSDRVILTRRYEFALQGWKPPVQHTRAETVQRQQKQGGGALAIGATSTATPAVAPKPAQSDALALWIGGGVVVAAALLIGWGVSRLVKAARMKAELETERLKSIQTMEGSQA